MKKILFCIIIVVFFLLGISIGNNNNKYSEMFENTKDEFESEIVIPNNNYSPKDLKPEEGLLNKIANKIDNLIQKISDKIM